MEKSHPLLLSLILITFSGEIYAKYTQMIVDNNNRIMPIFFHDDMGQQTQAVETNQHVLSNTPPTYHPPHKPVVLPPKRPASLARAPARDPLSGPYLISPERHQIMEAAYSALGIPYIYGGNNPARGLDCSSLMQFIHKKALGVRIPRTAAQQRKRSKTVNYSNLQPGDMLFFKINRRSNHVGIYIGEGKFIHASSSNKRATIASMSLPYWKKRFVKFGSYLNS